MENQKLVEDLPNTIIQENGIKNLTEVEPDPKHSVEAKVENETGQMECQVS